MPIYEYQCTKCGNKFENLTNTCCAPSPKCPKCQADTEKLMSTFAASVEGGTGGQGHGGGGGCCSGGGCGCG